MSWTHFIQSLIFLCLGAHLNSCGRANALFLDPIFNAVARVTKAISERRSKTEKEQGSIAPQISS